MSANWVRIPVFPFQLTPGFVILCGANIVGNIISAENRSNLLSRAKPGNPASCVYKTNIVSCLRMPTQVYPGMAGYDGRIEHRQRRPTNEYILHPYPPSSESSHRTAGQWEGHPYVGHTNECVGAAQPDGVLQTGRTPR